MKFAIIDQQEAKDFNRNIEGPWSVFFSVFKNMKYEIINHKANPDVVIFMNDHKTLRRSIKRKLPNVKLILVIWESPVTKPSDFKDKNLDDYDLIFSPSKLWLSRPNVIYFNWPQSTKVNWTGSFEDWARRKNKVVLFASNKFSFVHGEMYSVRRKIIEQLDNNIDVYGLNWSKRILSIINLVKASIRVLLSSQMHSLSLKQHAFVRPKSYFGPRATKIELMHYKFCLVVENEINYVSEKLFDAISFGCIPLYIGPELSEFGLPSDIVLRIDHVEEIENVMKQALQFEKVSFNRVLKARDFLNSERAQEYDNVKVLKEIALRICEKAMEWK